MRVRKMTIAAALALQTAPAQGMDFTNRGAPKPHSLATFSLAERDFEMRAVTRRARADTNIERAFCRESANMAKVMPGYPQPALITVKLHLKF